MSINELTIVQAAQGLARREFSAVELTEACLKRIEARNKALNAFISITADEALSAAARADARLAAGDAPALTGIPFGVKDAICTAGARSTGAAKILDNYVPPFEATVIQRIRAQGAVLLGKQNCDAFGHGASNENSMYGPVRNPHDESKVAGGSSGGSIRQPASLCGVVGLRPSYGRNSRYGVMPMASSLDTVGPITKTVADAALLMEVMAGQDPFDATTVAELVPEYSKAISSDANLRIGIPKEYFELEGLDEEVLNIVKLNIENLRALGGEIIDVSLPYTKYSIPVYYLIVPSEDSSNLARLDGMRYGVRADGSTLEQVYAASRAQGFPDEVKRRIMIGTYALSAGYYDAYYRQAGRVRTLICQDFERVFANVDVLVTPTSPFPAFGIGEKTDDVLAMYLADVFVAPASVAGLPALSVPAGHTKAGLPVGIQIIGPRLAEARVLQVGYKIESM